MSEFLGKLWGPQMRERYWSKKVGERKDDRTAPAIGVLFVKSIVIDRVGA